MGWRAVALLLLLGVVWGEHAPEPLEDGEGGSLDDVLAATTAVDSLPAPKAEGPSLEDAVEDSQPQDEGAVGAAMPSLDTADSDLTETALAEPVAEAVAERAEEAEPAVAAVDESASAVDVASGAPDVDAPAPVVTKAQPAAAVDAPVSPLALSQEATAAESQVWAGSSKIIGMDNQLDDAYSKLRGIESQEVDVLTADPGSFLAPRESTGLSDGSGSAAMLAQGQARAALLSPHSDLQADVLVADRQVDQVDVQPAGGAAEAAYASLLSKLMHSQKAVVKRHVVPLKRTLPAVVAPVASDLWSSGFDAAQAGGALDS